MTRARILRLIRSAAIPRVFIVSLVGMVTVADLAVAQLSSIEAGDLVRLRSERSRTPNQWETGEVTAIDSTSITIEAYGRRVPLFSPIDDVTRLQLSLGRSSRRGFRDMVTGAALGFVIGAGLTLLSADAETGSSNDWINAGLAGTVVGGTAGGIIGFTSEEWVEIVLDQPTDSETEENR